MTSLSGEMRGEAAPYSLVPSEEENLLAECHQEKVPRVWSQEKVPRGWSQEKVPRGWSQEKIQGAKEQGCKNLQRR